MEKHDPIRQRVLEFIRQKRVGVIATESHHEPHAATVFFHVDDDFFLYFVTTQHTQKIKDIETNSRVAVVIGAEDSPDTVQLSGKATVLSDADSLSIISTVTAIASSVQYHWPPIAKLSLDHLVAVKIVPEWMRWLDLRPTRENSSFTEREMQLQYVQIIP